MATMGSYCKAYPVSRFEEYKGWREKPLLPLQEDADDEPLEERYLFLQETLVVTDGVFLDERIVFDEVTPEWTEFCETTLEFSVPDVGPMPVFATNANDGESDERISTEAVQR